MPAYTLTSSNVKPSSGARYLPRRPAGVAIAAGQPVYLADNNTYNLADAGVIGSGLKASNRTVGIAPVSVALGEPLAPVYEDPDFTHGLTTVAAADVIVVARTGGGGLIHVSGMTNGAMMVVMVATSSTKAKIGIINGPEVP